MVDFTSAEGVGYGFIALGVLFFLVEATMPGFFLGVPATVLVILGAFALLAPDFSVFTAWAPILAVAVGIPALFVTIWTYRRMAPPDDAPTTMTAENLVGREGRVLTAVTTDAPRGKVKVDQQVWSALAREGTIPVDGHVRVVSVDGVILIVEPVTR